MHSQDVEELDAMATGVCEEVAALKASAAEGKTRTA